MNTKTIKLDINKRLYEKITAKQGDTKSRFLLFHLLDGASPFSLVNRTVRVYGLKPDKKEIFNDLKIVDANKGHCELELTNQALAIIGDLDLELAIYEGESKLTSIPFTVDVLKSINSTNAIESSNEYKALDRSLTKVEEWNNEFADKSGKLEQLYTERLNGIDSHLVENTKQIETKMDKSTTNIAVSQINKNLGKFDQTYMTEEFLKQITGGAPIQSTPAREGITRDKLADNSIPLDVLNFIKKSNNLLNKNKLIAGYTISSTTGELVANSSFYVSEFEYLKANQLYSCNLIGRWALYDSNLNFISSNTTATFTTPENTYYGRFVVAKASINKAQVNIGSLTDFDNYAMKLERSDNGLFIKPSPKSINKEALNKDSITPYSSIFFKKSTNLFNPNNVIFNKKISSTGEIIDDTTTVLSDDFIDVEENQIYSKPTTMSCEVACYDIDNKFMSTLALAPTTATFKTPIGCFSVKVSPKKSAYTTFWFNKGDVLLPFEEFAYELQSTNQFPIKINESLLSAQKDVFKIRPFRYSNFNKLSYQQLITHINSSIYNGCTIEDLGISSDGVNRIYGMSYGDTANKPVVLFFNQHASEWKAVYYVLEFFKILNGNKFYDQTFIESLKEKLSFYFVVTANPYGYINDSYVNANGVNLNRNWDNNWESYNDGGVLTNNKGTAPFSEVDIQRVRDKILELKPHMVIDCHTTNENVGGLETNKVYTEYRNLMLECYNKINEVFDDSSLATQEWNTGSSPTSVGWVGKQLNKNGGKIIPAMIEHLSWHPANYGTTAILYLCYYLKQHLDGLI